MNRSFPFFSLAGAVMLAMTVAACENNGTPASSGPPAAAKAPFEKSFTAPGPAGQENPAFSATDKDKAVGSQDSGEFF